MSVSHLAENAATFAVGFLHQTEDGEVPVVDLAHEGFESLHHQQLRGQNGFILH